MQNVGPTLVETLMGLPPSTRLFTLFFLSVVAYSLYSSTRILLSLLSLKRQSGETILKTTTDRSMTLSNRLANLRQLHTFTLLLFGLCSAMYLYTALNPVELWTRYEVYVLNQLDVFLKFAAVIFLTLLSLHSIQWFLSIRVHSFLTSSPIAR